MKKIFIVLLLYILCIQGVTAESGTFEDYYGAVTEFTTGSDPFYTPYVIGGIEFNEIDYFTDLQGIRLTYLDTGQYTLNHTGVSSITVPFVLTNETDNSTIGTGNIGYARTTGDKLIIYVYFDSWNIAGQGTGNKCCKLYYNHTQLGLLIRSWESTGDYFTDPYHLGLSYYLGGCGRAVAMVDVTDKYQITHAYEFIHYWESEDINEHFAFLNVTKVINDIQYNSSINISSPYHVYLDAVTAVNESVPVSKDYPPIHLQVIDSQGSIYNAYLFGGGNTTLTGKVVDRSNNHIINNVSITWYINDLVYDIETYNSPFTKTLPAIVNKAEIIKSGYTQENYTLNLNTQTNYLFKITQIGVYAENTSTIYGNVFDYATNNTIVNAHITIDNSSWSDDTYSNSYGYYEFVNLSIGKYNISTYAFDYNPDDRIFSITANNTAYLNDIYLSKTDALATPTPRATSGLGLPIYSEQDIWTLIIHYTIFILILVGILFIYRLYDKSNIRKIWSGNRRR